VPIGFVADHMEVVYDLDVVVAERAAALGLPFARAGTVGAAAGFVGMVAELMAEREDPAAPRRALGRLGVAEPDERRCCC
jgi:ferrochelatase